jgi:hypothetical protein
MRLPLDGRTLWAIILKEGFLEVKPQKKNPRLEAPGSSLKQKLSES